MQLGCCGSRVIRKQINTEGPVFMDRKELHCGPQWSPIPMFPRPLTLGYLPPR